MGEAGNLKPENSANEKEIMDAILGISSPESESEEDQDLGGSKKMKKSKTSHLSEVGKTSETEEEDDSEAEEEEEIPESPAERRIRLQRGETVPTNDIKPELRVVVDAIAAAIAATIADPNTQQQRLNGFRRNSASIKEAIAAVITEELRNKWPDVALGTFTVLFYIGKAAFILFLNDNLSTVDGVMGGGLETLADGTLDLVSAAARGRESSAEKKRRLQKEGYEAMRELTGKKKPKMVEDEKKPKTQAELDVDKKNAELTRAYPAVKKPPTDDEVAEAKRIRDEKKKGTATAADWNSLAELISKHSAAGNKPTGEELEKRNRNNRPVQTEEEKVKEHEKFKIIAALQVKEEVDKRVKRDGKRVGRDFIIRKTTKKGPWKS